MEIPFNKPYISGNEIEYIRRSLESGKISGDGIFTNKCHRYFEENYGFKKVLLTTSCTDALEMAAILCNIQPGDEVIAPSYTFVSTVNAFVLRGAKIVFADSEIETPNIDVAQIEALVTSKTKVILPVHYAGIACEMDKIVEIACQNGLFVVEDAAQAIHSYYKQQKLGSIGDFGAFSFHETKNIISGEGGMLVVNNEHFISRAEIIREKGTNRSAFFRGEVDKYGWVDIGSSFLPSDMLAAFLYAQLENLNWIQNQRLHLWSMYFNLLEPLQKKGLISLPIIPVYASNNAHMFYLVCSSLVERDSLIRYLKLNGVLAVFHYQSLHRSRFFIDKHDGRSLHNADRYSDCLLRLPLFCELKDTDVKFIVQKIYEFFGLKLDM